MVEQERELEGIRDETLNRLHGTRSELSAVREEAANLEAGLGAEKEELTQLEKQLKVCVRDRRGEERGGWEEGEVVRQISTQNSCSLQSEIGVKVNDEEVTSESIEKLESQIEVTIVINNDKTVILLFLLILTGKGEVSSNSDKTAEYDNFSHRPTHVCELSMHTHSGFYSTMLLCHNIMYSRSGLSDLEETLKAQLEDKLSWKEEHKEIAGLNFTYTTLAPSAVELCVDTI